MKCNFLPIRLCFINVYTYPNPKPTPYNYAKIVIIVVQCDKNDTVLMCAVCACPVAPSSLNRDLEQGFFNVFILGASYSAHLLCVVTLQDIKLLIFTWRTLFDVNEER